MFDRKLFSTSSTHDAKVYGDDITVKPKRMCSDEICNKWRVVETWKISPITKQYYVIIKEIQSEAIIEAPPKFI